MTWAWFASQNAMMNTYNVYRTVAILNVWWNVIALLPLVVTVSVFNSVDSNLFVWNAFVTKVLCHTYSTMIFHFKACPCHTDCIDGCHGCENPICFCNVSYRGPIMTASDQFNEANMSETRGLFLRRIWLRPFQSPSEWNAWTRVWSVITETRNSPLTQIWLRRKQSYGP